MCSSTYKPKGKTCFLVRRDGSKDTVTVDKVGASISHLCLEFDGKPVMFKVIPIFISRSENYEQVEFVLVEE